MSKIEVKLLTAMGKHLSLSALNSNLQPWIIVKENRAWDEQRWETMNFTIFKQLPYRFVFRKTHLKYVGSQERRV